ncbi:hypothetical protein MUY27_13070 [Mucilaginibacter sp. RS28]|uniref:Uncharacterized protein n=1 Tax=Mucilaginibacter straminoryzae TaxID=2932774 RepID=A0A9X1X6M7_9SPHI|nr:hypothetical protein [Mucilaginibacter straminoryzae]MCJ8210643.1 hypothetical protein [Mucilaginibacter straminoryzae]
MSIRKKIEEGASTIALVRKLENTLFDLLDDDDPVNIYMLTDICKQLNVDITAYFSGIYTSGRYNLKVLSKGDFNVALNVAEALYETCVRFQKFELALIVNTEIAKALQETGVDLKWIDGKFI